MDYLIVFDCEKKMLDFQEKNPNLPRGWDSDFLENGKLSQSSEEYWDGFYELPDVIYVGTNYGENRKEIFFSMPKRWRRQYWQKDEDGDFNGYWLGIPRKKLDSETLNDIDKHIIYYNTESVYIWHPPATRPMNNNEIINNPEKPPDPIVDGLLGRAESFIISAAAGVGKSLMVTDIAYRLANCDNLWGMFPIPKPVTSLIIQSEVNIHAQKKRLDKFLKANPDFKSDRIFTLGSSFDSDCQISGMLNDRGFQEQVVSAINEVKADVVFIDPLISYNPVDENNNTEMRKVFNSFEAAIRETGASAIFTHHVSKMGGLRGAGAIRDWVANVLELEIDRRENGEARIKVTHDKARNFAEVDPFYLTRTKDLSFELAESKATRQEDERLQCVVDALNKAGGRIEGQSNFTKEISKMKNGVQSRTAVNRIKDARECGLILELDGGIGNVKIYKFPEK